MRNQNTKTTQDEYEKHAHALGAAIVGLLLAQRGGPPAVAEQTTGEQNYWTLAELCDEFHCSRKTLMRKIEQHGIKLKERTTRRQKILIPLAEVKKLRRLWGK